MTIYLISEGDWRLVRSSKDSWRLNVHKGGLLAFNFLGRGPVGVESAVAELEGQNNGGACSQQED